jgi:hypothetical protein
MGVFALLATTAILSPADPPASPPGESLAIREMAALLEERIREIDPLRLYFYVNEDRVRLIEQGLQRPRPVQERIALQLMYARELLNAGRNEDTLLALDALETDVRANDPDRWRRGATGVALLRAVANLRLGEQQNCAQLHNADSCLLPIRGQGVHQIRDPSARAAEILTAVLDREPDQLSARWLLNIAHMTLGTYPDGVPARHLIPPARFASEYPLPAFTNVAQEAKVDVLALSGGVVMEDFDRDDRLDLVVSASGLRDQLRFFHNSGTGTFEERTEQAGIRGELGGLNLSSADYDNDGLVDVLVLRGGWMGGQGRFPLSLLRNVGSGRFDDVTKAAGLLRFAPSQTAAWFDYDNDGWLDLFVGNESEPGQSVASNLFHNNRDGTFTDVAREAGVEIFGWVKGVTSGDYDNDGRPDLYLSVHRADNQLLHNDGPSGPGGKWRFTDVAAAAGVTQPVMSFGTFFFDYDNDGWQDLFVTGFGGFQGLDEMAQGVAADYLGLPTDSERGRLYRNRRDGTFAEVTKAMGLYRVVPTMGHNFGDLDNDGWLDIYLTTGNPDLSTLIPNRMFRNAEGKVFQDVTTAGNFGHLQKGHGVAFGDLDNDGDQDIFNQLGGAYAADLAYSALFENPGTSNRWVGLDLEGTRSNRKAMGARIEVVVETRTGRRSIHRVVSTGGSFGASPLRQHVGLGDSSRIVAVKIFWPVTGKTQTVDGLEAGRWYRIREGEPRARPFSVQPFAFPRPAPGHDHSHHTMPR